MVKYCDDPLKRHDKKISKGLRTISGPLYNLCQGRLNKNTTLCCTCRKTISDNPSIIDEVLSSPSTIRSEINERSEISFESDSEAVSTVFTSLHLSPPTTREFKLKT